MQHHSTIWSPWKDISQITPLFPPHIKYSLGDSSKIRFLLDKWGSPQPLNALTLFPNIFTLSLEKSNVISDFYKAQDRTSTYGETLDVTKYPNFPLLLFLLNHLYPNPFVWNLGCAPYLPQAPTWSPLSFQHLPPPLSFPSRLIWYPVVPSKVQGFLCKVAGQKVLTKDVSNYKSVVLTLPSHLCFTLHKL